MSFIDQNNAMISLEEALVPSPYLIDSRTEKDRLRFLVDFASLINFYDRTNNIAGDWTPFLLKDPVFLIASIAKVPFKKIQSLYLNTCLELQKALTESKASDFISNAFNRLFDQLIKLFHLIERWTHYMQKPDYTYTLKEYVINEVKQTYSALLWALLSLREQLYFAGEKIIPGIQPVNLYLYQSYDQKIWQDSKGKTPYWKLLDLKHPLELNTSYDFYIALKTTGNTLLTFLNSITEYANIEFETVKTQKAKFPDTMLLRTFTALMKTYKEQINTLSNKHLTFYYQDILKQKKQFAIADSVFICGELAKKDNTYKLPVNTLFDAGQDVNKEPILFESIKNTSLNPAIISSVYTLSQGTLSNKNTGLYFQKIEGSTTVKKDEEGQTEQWKTFGSQIAPTGTQETMSFACASPMLYLEQATSRIVTLEFVCTDTIDSTLFYNATYFLSTQAAWFQIPDTSDYLTVATEDCKLTITITLQPTDPAIAAFLKNPDGLTATWPMFKLVFSELTNLTSPPEIVSLDISVNVKGLSTFQLYNDYGALAGKKPFQPLGPTPEKGQSFILGSAEIFSKYVTSLTLTYNWDNLPGSFSDYYEQYNDFLLGVYNIIDKESFIDWLKSIFKKKEKEIMPVLVFDDTCFRVQFQLMQNGLWQPCNMDLTEVVDEENSSDTETIDSYSLFSIEKDADTLSPKQIFGSTDIKEVQKTLDPTLQNETLVFSDTSTSGFIKMQLEDPMYGFGLNLYPKVVSAVALYNAELIAESFKSTPNSNLVNAPNLPYAPIVGLFTVDYEASNTYYFDGTDNTYPIECFYYTPFQNFKVYDTTSGVFSVGTTIGSPTQKTNTLPLLPAFKSPGQLFLEITAMIVPGEVSFYFELARDYTNSNVSTNPNNYYYLGTQGWTPLALLDDGTNGFSCSGIITFNIPEDITNNHPTMPGDPDKSNVSYWISITAENAPDKYAQTVFLNTNGIELKRTGTNYLYDTNAPKINAGTIKSPHSAIPQIATITQPFQSFGGVAYETDSQMNIRVSTRLKTKDRLVSSSDYFRVIKGNFPNIYYSKTVYTKQSKTTSVFVVKQVDDCSDSNAFMPLVSECEELEIQNYLNARNSTFADLAVSNFDIHYIKITASVLINKGYQPKGVAKQINTGINVFLSPWIVTDQQQITIDKGIYTAQIASFIQDFESIAEIESISIQLGIIDSVNNAIEYGEPTQEIIPKAPSVLLVPSLDNTSISYHL